MAATVNDKVTLNSSTAGETSTEDIIVIPDKQYETIAPIDPDVWTCYFPPTEHKDKPDDNNEPKTIIDIQVINPKINHVRDYDFEKLYKYFKIPKVIGTVNSVNQNYYNND